MQITYYTKTRLATWVSSTAFPKGNSEGSTAQVRGGQRPGTRQAAAARVQDKEKNTQTDSEIKRAKPELGVHGRQLMIRNKKMRGTSGLGR